DKTSPYKFYQFWLNASDEDVENFVKVFSLKSKEEIDRLIAEHSEAPHLRVLQKALAEELTERVHGNHQLEMAIEASNILFGKSTSDQLKKLSERDFLDVFQGVEQVKIPKDHLSDGVSVIDLLSDVSGFLQSKGEARRALKENSISVNKEKANDSLMVTSADLINDKYVLLQRGKKKYFIVEVG
ncbi:MAG: tyrosine--tRNA ligase, partial [Cryomorphaceae bacterium]